MKKLFASLMLGFGAALGVFVALAMPPGGWGVAVGVGLGLLGCLPLLLVMMMLIGRGHTDRRQPTYEEAPQPIIILQQPPMMPLGYDLHPGQPGYNYAGYVEAPDYYQPQYSLEAPCGRTAQPPQWAEPRRLPSNRRQNYEQTYSQPGYYQSPSPPQYAQPYAEEYYAQPEYEEEYYYDAPPAQPEQYDAYYGAPQSRAYDYQYQEPARPVAPVRPRPVARRPARPAQSRRPAGSDTSQAVEADFRTIGDNE